MKEDHAKKLERLQSQSKLIKDIRSSTLNDPSSPDVTEKRKAEELKNLKDTNTITQTSTKAKDAPENFKINPFASDPLSVGKQSSSHTAPTVANNQQHFFPPTH